MPFDHPTEIVRTGTRTSNIVNMLNARYLDWWQLDKIIPNGETTIYYFIPIQEDMITTSADMVTTSAVAIE